MPQRPIRSLAVIGVLASGDYLLWKWSVGANHDVVALVAGMTLIPLLLALVWLAVVAGAHLLAALARRSRPALAARARAADGRTAAGTRARRRRGALGSLRAPASPAAVTLTDPTSPAVGAASSSSPPSKLAA